MVACSAMGISRAVERAESGDWRVPASGSDAAQQPPPPAAVSRLLALAAGLRAARFERGEPADLARYGLAEPLFTISYTLTGADGIRKTILGGQPAEDSGVFGMIRGQPGIFVMDSEIAGLCQEFLTQ